MINRQQGFTLLEVMAALAIFSMLSVLAFMIFSQASELHQRSQKEIQQFNQLQRTITILDNDLLQLVQRRVQISSQSTAIPGRRGQPPPIAQAGVVMPVAILQHLHPHPDAVPGQDRLQFRAPG